MHVFMVKYNGNLIICSFHGIYSVKIVNLTESYCHACLSMLVINRLLFFNHVWYEHWRVQCYICDWMGEQINQTKDLFPVQCHLWLIGGMWICCI